MVVADLLYLHLRIAKWNDGHRTDGVADDDDDGAVSAVMLTLKKKEV